MNLSVLLWNAIIKINPKIKYNGNSELILKNKYLTLIKKGYIDDFLFFCNNSDLSIKNNVSVIKEIIQDFPEIIEENYKKFTNPDFFKIYALELAEKNYPKCLSIHVPGEKTNSDIVCSIIEKYPHFMKYYIGETFYSQQEKQKLLEHNSKKYYNENIINYSEYNNLLASDYTYIDEKVIDTYAKAIKNGYDPLEDITQNSILTHFDSVMEAAVNFEPNYIRYYKPTNYRYIKSKKNVVLHYDEKVFQAYIEKGGQVNKEIVEQNKFMASSDIIMKKIIDQDPMLLFELEGNFSEFQIKYFFEKTGKTAQELYDELLQKAPIKLNELFKYTSFVKEILINDLEFIKYYSGQDNFIFDFYIKECEKRNIKLNEDLVNKENFTKSDYFMSVIIKQNPNLIKYYNGNNKFFFENYIKECKKRNIKLNEDLVNKENFTKSDYFMSVIIKQNPNLIKYYNGNNKLFFENYINDENIPTIDMFCYNKLFFESIPYNLLIKIINSTDLKILGNLIFDRDVIRNLRKILRDVKFKNIHIDLNVVNKYNFDRGELLANFPKLEEFFSAIDIPINLFIDHSFSSNYNWLKDILTIINNNDISRFNEVKNLFIKKVFTSNTKAKYIKNINLILKNYMKYPEFCLSLISLDRDFTKEEQEKINYLFGLNIVLDGIHKPKDINFLNNIGGVLKENYNNKFNKLKIEPNIKKTDKIKDLVCTTLFNESYYNMLKILRKYGSTKELIQLRVDNQNTHDIIFDIEKMIIYTSIIEELQMMENEEKLLVFATNILDNYEYIINNSLGFYNIEEKYLKIYEKDIQINLTKLKNIKNYDSALDKEKTNKYGVDVLDFSDKKYIILCHVLSASEKVDDLVLGNAPKDKTFISLSASSWANQVYYGYNDKRIIFGCSTLLDDLFVCSSKANMSSNSYVSKYGNGISASDFPNIKQRGILETSDVNTSNNNEFFCFREGLKFDCIILPGGREATEEEIKIAKEYGLKFVVTQEIGKQIENPKKIEYEEEQIYSKKNDDIHELEKFKEVLFSNLKSKERKIAIFSDSHALFEPTLAILEDARKNGITEIYSLGDNIGTGPNPKEVLELLEKYDVKSVMGNHEMYTIGELEKLKEHLTKTGAYIEAKNNSEWTRSKLTDEQIKNLKLYPLMRELQLGGKKLLLCHFNYDYNTGKLLNKSDEYDMVLQGHIHFEKEKEKTLTLRGAGLGENQKSLSNTAYYLILTEKPEGGYTIEKKRVDFDLKSLHRNINSSDLSNHDKEKISNWTKRSK